MLAESHQQLRGSPWHRQICSLPTQYSYRLWYDLERLVQHLSAQTPKHIAQLQYRARYESKVGTLARKYAACHSAPNIITNMRSIIDQSITMQPTNLHRFSSLSVIVSRWL